MPLEPGVRLGIYQLIFAYGDSLISANRIIGNGAYGRSPGVRCTPSCTILGNMIWGNAGFGIGGGGYAHGRNVISQNNFGGPQVQFSSESHQTGPNLCNTEPCPD